MSDLPNLASPPEAGLIEANGGELPAISMPAASRLVSAEALAALAAAMDFADQALSPATLRAYRAAWQHFCAWCDAARWPALPAAPETVGAYLAALSATHTTSTLVQRLGVVPRPSPRQSTLAVSAPGHPQHTARHSTQTWSAGPPSRGAGDRGTDASGPHL